jgi:hypothetical protein
VPYCEPTQPAQYGAMQRRAIGAALAVVLAGCVVAACGSSGGTSQGSTSSTPGSTTATTAPAATTSTTIPVACVPIGGIGGVRVAYPQRMSSLIGKDVRTGTRSCAERFVIELQRADLGNPTSAAFPGYWVRYAKEPITLNPSGQPVTLRGGAVLLVSMGSWMMPTTGAGYAGPRDVFPTNVKAIREYRLI